VIAKQRDIDRREAQVVRDVERGAVVEQELHELGAVGRVLRLRRPVQRRVATLVVSVHGRRIAPELAVNGGQVALAQRAPQGAFRQSQAMLCLDRLVDERHDFAEPAGGGDVHGSEWNAPDGTLHDRVRIGAMLQQELHDAGVAFAYGVMQWRERSHGNLARQRRRLAQQLAHRHFIAAGAGGNHAGAVGVRVGHGCGPVAFRGRGDVLVSAAVGRMARCPRREPKEGTLAINSNA
jgi:hypothetical protein